MWNINLDPDLHFYKISSNRIIDPIVKCKILKLREKKNIENIDDHVFGEEVLDTTPKAHERKYLQVRL